MQNVIEASEMKQEKKILSDKISRLAEEVVLLGGINDEKRQEAESLYDQWCGVQVKTAELLLHILEVASGKPDGVHCLHAVIDVLKRDEQRLQQDLARLGSVHDREDANFKTKRKELEIEKATAEDLLLQHQAATEDAASRRDEHLRRIQTHRMELATAHDTFKDDVLSYARSIFLV
eukprot:TRINITY_DN3969_c0_g1_i1.p1 TRINITY_DN3969_c0_g1~~TRINITY_DN3969_c0_g1_i1.p1  ORF type:complete len:199 (+),score=79.62 TRINITY_DN3969_c0_g1_i1:69-599(+)